MPMAKAQVKSESKNKKNTPASKSGAASVASSFSFIHQFWFQACFLALVCFVFYSNTFNNGYAVDDFLIIDKNEAIVKGIKGIPQILTTDVFDSYYRRYNADNRLGGGRYRPLSVVTFALEHQFFAKHKFVNGADPFTSDNKLVKVRHVNNVLLYIISVVVLLYFLRNVIFVAQPILAFLTVLLFAIHPIHTEVVANIKSRDELLSLLFITLTLLNAFRYSETKKWGNLVWALVCFFLALLSKEYAVSLLVLIPLLLYVCKISSVTQAIKSAIPFLGMFVLYVFMRNWFVPINVGNAENDILNNPYLFASASQKIASEITTLLRYVKLLVFPHPLSADYSYAQIAYSQFSDVAFGFSLLFHLALIVVLFYFTKQKSVLAFALAFYLFNLLLVSNLVFSIGATMGERLIYHSSLGFCMLLAYFMYWAYQKSKRGFMANFAATALVLLIVVLCGIKTIARNKNWESNSTLYRIDVLAAPNSAITNGNAGNAYLQMASIPNNANTKSELLNSALLYLNKAISIYPGYTQAYINRGNVFFQLGDLQHAKQDWDTAKQQYPTHPDLPELFGSYYINSSVKKGNEGKFNEAINELHLGALYAPKNTIILFNMGYYYNMVGKKDSAISTFQKIIDINPTDTLAVQCASFIKILKSAP